MQKSVMDIWTTLVQLRKCNTSHASKWRESIALSVCRGSKVLWQLWAQAGQSPRAGCRSLSPLSPAAQSGCFQPWWGCGSSAPLKWGSCALWCCCGDAEEGTGWSESHRSHLFLWTLGSRAQLKIIVVTVAHMQLTEILRFKSCFCKCWVPLLHPKDFGTQGYRAQIYSSLIFGIPKLLLTWETVLAPKDWYNQTDTVWFKIRYFCKNKALQNIRWGEICHIYSSNTKEISLPNTNGSRHLFLMPKIQMP